MSGDANHMNIFFRWISKHYIWSMILFTILLAVLRDMVEYLGGRCYHSTILEGCVFYIPFYFAIVWPFVLTFAEIMVLILSGKRCNIRNAGKVCDILVLGFGYCYTWGYLSFDKHMEFLAGWQTQLSNLERHSAVAPQYRITIWVLVLAAFAGYLVLTYAHMEDLPPLISVLGIAAMYMGNAIGVVWIIQIWNGIEDFWILFLPANWLLITIRTILSAIWKWKKLQTVEDETNPEESMNKYRGWMEKSVYWPLWALLLVWPLLGVLLVILMLFGQVPDAVIRAFTETADWNLSQKIAPQNIYYDEHYLCTVAAGGHKKVVKPQRLGIRHGHSVIVNRQLCVANAFEQILEERSPRFHKAVRHFYDTYGFPIAKMIHSKYMADVIYILMKPLEWFFLIVLYLVDVHPENRIALQYTGKSLKDFGL